MFFVKANGMCGHVGMFSRKDPKTGDIYIYDASTTVGERKLWPGELTPPKGIYKKIYYTSPLKNTTA